MESPLEGVRFFLSFDNDRLYAVVVEHGRVIPMDETPARSGSKHTFLANLGSAQPVLPRKGYSRQPSYRYGCDRASNGEGQQSGSLPRFPDSTPQIFLNLGPAGGRSCCLPFRAFFRWQERSVRLPATAEQYGNAAVAFAKILAILEPYLPMQERPEVSKVPSAL